MSSLVVFDTSILLDQFRSGRYQARILASVGLIRTSAVVLAELWRGVNNSAERKLLLDLQKNHPILVPTTKNWLESGEILGRIRTATGFAGAKLRDLHFDVLIALTAYSNGARLITSNRSDFELIARYLPVQLEIWP